MRNGFSAKQRWRGGRQRRRWKGMHERSRNGQEQGLRRRRRHLRHHRQHHPVRQLQQLRDRYSRHATSVDHRRTCPGRRCNLQSRRSSRDRHQQVERRAQQHFRSRHLGVAARLFLQSTMSTNSQLPSHDRPPRGSTRIPTSVRRRLASTHHPQSCGRRPGRMYGISRLDTSHRSALLVDIHHHLLRADILPVPRSDTRPPRRKPTILQVELYKTRSAHCSNICRTILALLTHDAFAPSHCTVVLLETHEEVS